MRYRRSLLAGIGLALAALAPAAAQVTRGGPLPPPLPLFPADNWWNLDVSAAPLDPRSAALIAWIGNDALHPDFGGDAGGDQIYGLPYIVVPGSQPLEPVEFVLYGDESDAGAPGGPPGYPIPPQARTQPKWIEGGAAGGGDDGDHHMLIVDRDRRLLFELYQAHWNAGAGRWQAGSGAVFPLDQNRRRPEGWTSADAAGLAILPGLVRYDEVYESAEPIRHAFRFTLRDSDGYVFPASHAAGDNSAALPMGARLRLKANKDISGFAAPVRKIFQAMKTYGLILADNGSDMYVTGSYDPRWDNDVLNPAFAALRASDFEVVELGWRPAGGGACAAAPTVLCLGSRFSAQATWRTRDGHSGAARAVALTADTGYFWFFDPGNVEVVLKVLNGCALNQRHWVFAGGLTDVRTVITVTDTRSGVVKTYTNPQGTPFAPLQDTGAFPSCP